MPCHTWNMDINKLTKFLKPTIKAVATNITNFKGTFNGILYESFCYLIYWYLSAKHTRSQTDEFDFISLRKSTLFTIHENQDLIFIDKKLFNERGCPISAVTDGHRGAFRRELCPRRKWPKISKTDKCEIIFQCSFDGFNGANKIQTFSDNSIYFELLIGRPQS